MTLADQPEPAPGSLDVAGTGTASAAPDIARIQLAAWALRTDLTGSLATAGAALTRMTEALSRNGITGTDVVTSQLSVRPEEAWEDKRGPRITGYRAEHGLQVTVRDIGAVGRVIGETLAAAGDDGRLSWISFAVADEAGLRSRARELAWADARNRATQLAGLAGRRLGVVTAVAEGTALADPVPSAAMPMRALAAGGVPDVSVQPGEVSVTVHLTTRWELR